MKKEISNADDFNDYASNIFEAFLKTFTYENKLIRPATEDDGFHHNGYYIIPSFIYTTRGMKLANRMHSRLCRIGNNHFPNDDIEVESYLYIESD